MCATIATIGHYDPLRRMRLQKCVFLLPMADTHSIRHDWTDSSLEFLAIELWIAKKTNSNTTIHSDKNKRTNDCDAIHIIHKTSSGHTNRIRNSIENLIVGSGEAINIRNYYILLLLLAIRCGMNISHSPFFIRFSVAGELLIHLEDDVCCVCTSSWFDSFFSSFYTIDICIAIRWVTDWMWLASVRQNKSIRFNWYETVEMNCANRTPTNSYYNWMYGAHIV